MTIDIPRAYSQGRTIAFRGGTRSECPSFGKVSEADATKLRTAWLNGFRDAVAEDRLDRDTEWDDEAPPCNREG
jgi:ribosome modulation factor